ncbi:MAG: helix-turn-helix domain-containing protein [Carboxylicivirga sp.]|jgi:hypothetical protein|nr:helix-turn-helix domain-containing protein [Carboxylicivirga sp.]
MTLKSERDVSYGREKLYRDQIVTIGDLKEFKEDLLQQLSKIVADSLSSDTKKWVKSAEVRTLLGISPGTLQNMRVNGSLPYTKVGGIIFYDINDIQKMISKNKVSTITRLG